MKYFETCFISSILSERLKADPSSDLEDVGEEDEEVILSNHRNKDVLFTGEQVKKLEISVKA